MRVPEEIDIAANLERVRERMADAARRADRNPEEITLVAVTKAIEPAMVKQAIALGLRDFGENRVQEAEWKIPLLPEATWHMIGHLQRNKVKKALLIFDMIHSVDSLRLAQEIDRRASRIGARVPVLLEVNLSGEATKYGFRMAPRVTRGEEKETFFSYVEEILRLYHLEVRGLMTMAPLVAHPEEARPYFQRLRGLREELRERFPQASWEELSMGMTDDFEVAIEEGATMVRIGRAIFGERRE
ncbi:MAG TPA: YggS family pyridoxal phosphate-dependent enzyme [Chloroflexi bacterium]|nr:YggS family pyridoxal phosphate-dependent enzyme [Chloroflexota bacterium]